MSINACTINNTTIDSICANRRAVIITDLKNRLPRQQTGKGHVQVNPPRHIQQFTDKHIDDALPTELTYISVTVELNGQSSTQTMDRIDNVIPMVSVYDLKSDGTTSVNISDISTRVID